MEGTYSAVAFWHGDKAKLTEFPRASTFQSVILIRKTNAGIRVGVTSSLFALIYGMCQDQTKARELYLDCIKTTGVTGSLLPDGRVATTQQIEKSIQKAKRLFG